MKAITAVCATGATVPAGISAGRITRPHRDGENAEIQMYLSKLKDLVPYMPKNKKLSKLEVIQNVIDYICDLQSALETNTAGGSAAVAAAFDASAVLSGSLSASVGGGAVRQPLGIRSSPNRIQRRRPSSQQSNGSLGSNSSHSSNGTTGATNASSTIGHLHCDLMVSVHVDESVVDVSSACEIKS